MRLWYLAVKRITVKTETERYAIDLQLGVGGISTGHVCSKIFIEFWPEGLKVLLYH